jgi:elongation factor G
MGELHLEILVDRLLREYKVLVNVGQPQVTYRETVTLVSLGFGKFSREIAGKQQEAECSLEVSPIGLEKGLVFINEFPARELPIDFARGIEEGVTEASQNGPLAGFPMAGLQVVLKSVHYDPDTASHMAFKVAASGAFREAVSTAKPQLLEPVFRLDVLTPEEFMGNIIADLNGRRGKIDGMFARHGGMQAITGEAPLSTLFGYATDVRSVSQGRATFSMEFKQYMPVPVKVEQEILRKIGRL